MLYYAVFFCSVTSRCSVSWYFQMIWCSGMVLSILMVGWLNLDWVLISKGKIVTEISEAFMCVYYYVAVLFYDLLCIPCGVLLY